MPIKFFTYLKKQLHKLLNYLSKKKPTIFLIVTVSRQSLLNSIGKFILNEKNAHMGIKLSPDEEISIHRQYTLYFYHKKNKYSISLRYLFFKIY